MIHTWSAVRSACRIVVGIFVLCPLLLLPVVPHRAAAQGRMADAGAPTAVAYHLRIMFVDGVQQGRTMDAGVTGMLDSTGLLTATLIAASGMTSTVMGSLITNTFLTAKGKAATLTLGGKALRRGGMYGGVIAFPDGTAAGSWLMTPQTTLATLAFAATVNSGRHKGQDLGGTLSIAADRSGYFDGSLTLDDGATVVASGRMANGNLQVVLYLQDGGVVLGDAPKGRSFIGSAFYTSYKGRFAGPGTGDIGAWSAVVNS